MEKFPVLQNELTRLKKLYSYDILEMEPEDSFDDLTKLAASILEVPICLITLMDADWQAFISNIGTDMKGNQRELSFCRYCIVQEDILEIKDTSEDDRFSQNPLVVNTPNLRYYVGSPLIDEEGLIIGTVCGFDLKPRQMTDFQKVALKQITSTVMRLIQLRKANLERIDYKSELNRITKLKNRSLSHMSHEIKTSSMLNDDFKKILNDLRKEEGDELVNEFENIFKNRIPQDIDDLIRARKTRDFIEIKRKAHFLATTLLTLKFSHGLALSQELEQAVDNNQEASTLMLTDRFIDYLNGALTTI